MIINDKLSALHKILQRQGYRIMLLSQVVNIYYISNGKYHHVLEYKPTLNAYAFHVLIVDKGVFHSSKLINPTIEEVQEKIHNLLEEYYNQDHTMLEPLTKTNQTTFSHSIKIKSNE
jgi:hypothetical protein